MNALPSSDESKYSMPVFMPNILNTGSMMLNILSALILAKSYVPWPLISKID